jgi:hypothetical protein
MSEDDGPVRPYRSRERRPKFPGPFKIHPEDYLLDPITGYFYEDRTQFYHCPKTKLYFHHDSNHYYSFDREEDLYMDVDYDYGAVKMKFDFGDKDKVCDGEDLVVQALQGTKKVHDSHTKNKISITIKQQLPKKGSSKKASNKSVKQQGMNTELAVKETTDLVVERRQKSHQDDIEKWTQRIKECNDSDVPLPMTNSFSTPSMDLLVVEKVRRTKSGKPVCMLCKRKFVDVEKLEQHQMLSELHKLNLARAIHASGEKHSKVYLDRAHHRRVLYESQAVDPLMDVSELGSMMAPNLEEARKVVVTESVRPEDNLGDSNIGNKMLQKLGWDGGSLGRKLNSNGNGGAESLKNEWKRIEALARH